MSKSRNSRKDEKKKPGVFSKNHRESRQKLKDDRTLVGMPDSQKGKSVIGLVSG